jgi:hypothetical protein
MFKCPVCEKRVKYLIDEITCLFDQHFIPCCIVCSTREFSEGKYVVKDGVALVKEE